MAKKTFLADVVAQTITPESHHISKSGGDQVEWVITKGDAEIEFISAQQPPVIFTHGPQFSSEVPAVAIGTVEGEYGFAVLLQDAGGGQKKQASLQAILIVDG